MAAVATARLLATQPPGRIRSVLTWLRRGATPAGYQQALAARDAVTAVSMVCRGARGCVPRSVATALVCRASGVWPTWYVGVRRVGPFAAHAWVEADGVMVGEHELAGYFRPLIAVPPEGATVSGATVS
ncbi:lasso peptide biosynthesis B2 protein [Frankia sp. CiP1_Cm_nod2]